VSGFAEKIYRKVIKQFQYIKPVSRSIPSVYYGKLYDAGLKKKGEG
jgi:hypothetical protein